MKEDLGKLLLRVSVAGMMLPHGISKLLHGIGGIHQRVLDAGLPGFFAYGVHLGETVAPVLMILGFKSRLAALVLAFNMLVAIFLAHSGDVFLLGKGGGWAIELQALYLLGALSVALLGPGRFAVRNELGLWR